ncbi:hypothetical protein L195_g043775, partial [Trifolium pratense]
MGSDQNPYLGIRGFAISPLLVWTRTLNWLNKLTNPSMTGGLGAHSP